MPLLNKTAFKVVNVVNAVIVDTCSTCPNQQSWLFADSLGQNTPGTWAVIIRQCHVWSFWYKLKKRLNRSAAELTSYSSVSVVDCCRNGQKCTPGSTVRKMFNCEKTLTLELLMSQLTGQYYCVTLTTLNCNYHNWEKLCNTYQH